MSPLPFQKTSTIRLFAIGVVAASIGLALVRPGYGQVSPEEHKKHHPGQDKDKDGMSGMVSGNKGKGMGGGMEGMEKMMENMGKVSPKELYPTLMSLPDLTPEQREHVRGQAQARMHSGVALLSEGLERLVQATENQDYAAMQEATAQVREALARFESGLAAQRALAEGKPARHVALQWFKGEMNLQPPQGVEVRGSLFGLTWFHLVVMAMLTAFAAVMIWMYFHKMQRATLLLQSLIGGAGVSASALSPATESKVARPAAPPAADAPLGNSSAPQVLATGSTGKWSGKLRLGRIFDETPNVKTLRLMNPLGGELPFSFQPGQYLTVTILPEGRPVKRSYTIASSPTEHAYVDLTIKREDKGVESRYLHDRVQVGDLLDCAGPSGSFVFTGRECRCLVFIAAGVGITPLMCVTRYLTDRSWPGEIFLLYSCHSPRDFIFKEELEFLQRRHPNLHVVATVSKAEAYDWKGSTGRITKEFIEQSVPDITSRRVHVCGPKEMMEATEKFLAELGVPKEQVKTEAFGPAIGKPEPEPKPTGSTAAAPAAVTPNTSAAAATPAPITSEAPAVALGAIATTVTFSRSAKTAPLTPEKSVLEASEDLLIGVNIPFECRVGTCGVCKTKLISGQVTMAVQDALTPEDKAAGIILACQAKSTGNVVVEA